MDLNTMYLEETARDYRNLRRAEAAHERRLNDAAAESTVNARSGRPAAKSGEAAGLRRLLAGMRSRRSLLARLSTAGLAALVTSLSVGSGFASDMSGQAAVRKRRKNKRRKKRDRCPCDKKCGQSCCVDGELCDNGVCIDKKTCPAGADICEAGVPTVCGRGEVNCVCFETIEGGTSCGLPESLDVDDCGQCISSDDCNGISSDDCNGIGIDGFCAKGNGICGCPEGPGVCVLACPDEPPLVP